MSKGAEVLSASARDVRRIRRASRGTSARAGLVGFDRLVVSGRWVLLATSVGTAGALSSRPGLRLPHRGVLLAPFAVLGVLAALALPWHGSGASGAGAVAARHGVLAGLAPGADRAGLLSLPAAAQGPVSAALGRDLAAYRIRGLGGAQSCAAALGAVRTRRGSDHWRARTRFAIALKAFGRAGTLRPLAPVSPVASANRVSYARGPVREWWANGPLGLEQGFDIARRPAGRER
jgi:hypothetical protein